MLTNGRNSTRFSRISQLSIRLLLSHQPGNLLSYGKRFRCGAIGTTCTLLISFLRTTLFTMIVSFRLILGTTLCSFRRTARTQLWMEFSWMKMDRLFPSSTTLGEKSYIDSLEISAMEKDTISANDSLRCSFGLFAERHDGTRPRLVNTLQPNHSNFRSIQASRLFPLLRSSPF